MITEEISKTVKFNRYTYDCQNFMKYYENVPIIETKQIFNDIDPYGEENWNE